MATSKAKNQCPHCGAKMVEYKHGLSRGLAQALYRITQNLSSGNEFHIGECGMTYSQRENARKLQYWGVIEKIGDKDSKGGRWKITAVGMAFARGNARLRKSVWTYRGAVVRFEGDPVRITDLTDGWKYRPQYAQEAMPV